MIVMQILYLILIGVSKKMVGWSIWNFDYQHMYKVHMKYFASGHSSFLGSHIMFSSYEELLW
jgi:hypothetical protein